MSGTNEATPPAQGGLTKEDVQKLIDTSITTAIAPISQSQAALNTGIGDIKALLGKSAGDEPGKAKSDANAPVTLDQIGQLIDTKLNTVSQQQQTQAARNGYLAEKLKDIPEVYHSMIGADPTKFAGEEQTLREKYKGDLKAAGVEGKSLGNATTEGGTTPEQLPPVDRSKMTAMDLLNSDRKTA